MHQTIKIASTSISKLEYEWENGYGKLYFNIYNKKEDKVDVNGIFIELMSLLNKCDECRQHISSLQFSNHYSQLSKRLDIISNKIDNALLNIKIIKKLRKEKLAQIRIKVNANASKTNKLKKRISIVGSAINSVNINRKSTGGTDRSNINININKEECEKMEKMGNADKWIISNSNIVGLASAPVLTKKIDCKIPQSIILTTKNGHNKNSNRMRGSLNLMNININHRLSKMNRKVSQMAIASRHTKSIDADNKSKEQYESKLCEMSEEKLVVTVTNHWIKIDLNCGDGYVVWPFNDIFTITQHTVNGVCGQQADEENKNDDYKHDSGLVSQIIATKNDAKQKETKVVCKTHVEYIQIRHVNKTDLMRLYFETTYGYIFEAFAFLCQTIYFICGVFSVQM